MVQDLLQVLKHKVQLSGKTKKICVKNMLFIIINNTTVRVAQRLNGTAQLWRKNK